MTPAPAPLRKLVDDAAIAKAVAALKRGAETLIFVGADAVRAAPLELIAAVAAKTGSKLMGRTSLSRTERGAGTTPLPRLPYAIDAALAALEPFRTIILLGAPDPVGFFGYPGKPSRLAPNHAEIITLADGSHDLQRLAEQLADAVGATTRDAPRSTLRLPDLPTGALNVEKAMAAVAALMPEGAIIVDESVTATRFTGPMTVQARPHDLLQLTGGAIGMGPSAALGASVACPDRKVINLEADGSAMYTLQALWSQARVSANVLTIIWSNRSYAILTGELMAVGASNPGVKALDMLSLDHPALDWVSLAKGMGVPGARAATAEEFTSALCSGLAERGPFLIEALI